MKNISFVDVGAWNRTVSNRYLHFSWTEKKKFLGILQKINTTEAMDAKCLYCRQALEILVRLLLRREVKDVNVADKHLNEKIELIAQNFAGFKTISHEFHVIRGITNGYIHGEGRNPKADRHTLAVVLNKIQKWFASYAQYTKRQEYRQRKKSNLQINLDKNTLLYIAGFVILAVLGYFAWLKLM